ncbi:hypothetical protein SEA_KABOCHA_128 [Gordonia phage Kabocha]|uniref:Uncharacterized protein n=1 Tax=Gordonia phage ChisanaKitsune TaxID=2871538 RepID=A0AAE7XF51_9CAUD|nr:hypothetical protein PQD15_gp125 [Gordonia phage ChisanaKitsune]QZE10895.1 hypothetical protein SEA_CHISANAKITSUNE_125 [Gordonia phage ChisanaKitsune]WAA19914.1 hypothetical protein SEA_KABOCHA_128 [Gordonia phage Kabocha]WAA20102.1 hypothetical protein SEA_HANEM_125 [Gordonia phage Hanem]
MLFGAHNEESGRDQPNGDMAVSEANYPPMHAGDQAVEMELPNGVLVRVEPGITPDEIESAVEATNEFRKVLRGYGEMN